MRKLPLLGVTYADLYRETKIQEAVLETLTREYEMAHVKEAKKIPTVKVLDPPVKYRIRGLFPEVVDYIFRDRFDHGGSLRLDIGEK